VNTSPRPPNRQVYEEAAEWLVEVRVGDIDAAMREQLDTWFRESPQHIRAFLELTSIWEEGNDADLDRTHSTDALIALARTTDNVATLPHQERVGRQSSDSMSMRVPEESVFTKFVRLFSRHPLLAGSVVIGCVAVASAALISYARPTYSTGVGQQRIIELSDGSTLELNSHSRVRVWFSREERQVDLIEGQALFHVAKDPTRPFVVCSDATRVRAVGTQFDVYRKPSGTTVTVLEGQVAVYSQGASPQGSSLVSAGEQVTLAPSAASQVRHTDVAAATAWTQHELVFDAQPLTDVAQEFNRYNTRKLIVSDARLESFHVTGVFSSTDPASLLRFLRAQPGIQVYETEKEIRISMQ
jgi:transmembrane sensor